MILSIKNPSGSRIRILAFSLAGIFLLLSSVVCRAIGAEEAFFVPSKGDSSWQSFQARGFKVPVSGVIYGLAKSPCCGVPLGGVGTGCLDVDAHGTWGFISAFNQLFSEFAFSGSRGNVFKAPLTRKLPDYIPMLGITAGSAKWILAASDILKGGTRETCVDPVFIDRRQSVYLNPIEGMHAAREIRYWGHFPMVDLEYELEALPETDIDRTHAAHSVAPLSVGLRAWAPFLPGDAGASNTPCAFFLVEIRNNSKQNQEGKLIFNFPGPPYQDPAELAPCSRKTIQENNFQGIEVNSTAGSYAFGLIGTTEVMSGGCLGRKSQAWVEIDRRLPDPLAEDRGTSLSVNYKLAPMEKTHQVFLLAWYAPEWQGAREHRYTTLYARRFESALQVALAMADQWENLLDRIIAWQEVIYSDSTLPDWLRDCLINNLALIAETSYWAQARSPLGDWCYQGGFFGMLESPRGCPQIECIPCTWYGGLPITLFFPELARSTLEGYRHFMREDGAVPFVIGQWGPPDMATPQHAWQISLNGPCFIHLVDRLWRTTGDRKLLDDFYPIIKQVNTFTVQLSSKSDRIIRMPDQGGMEWFEWGKWVGMASHMGGLRLATLRIVERMAETMGDKQYAGQCAEWFSDGSRSMETKMWNELYYLNYFDDLTGEKSDAIMGYQLDGEWAADFHGVPGVFRKDRIDLTLQTIRDKCTTGVKCGALSFASIEGKPLDASEKVAEYGATAMFLPEIMILAMTYMYAGEKDFGLEMLRRAMENMVCDQCHPWDLPNMIHGSTGGRHFGTDYYQNLMLWAAPAALKGQDLATYAAPGGLINRIVQMGK